MPGLATAANSHPSALLGTLRQTPGAIYLLVLLFVGLGLTSPHFLTTHNLVNIALQAAVVTIIALGMTLVILTEGIDLSLGPVLGLCGVVAALLMVRGIPLPAALLAAVAVAIVFGALNGVLAAAIHRDFGHVRNGDQPCNGADRGQLGHRSTDRNPVVQRRQRAARSS